MSKKSKKHNHVYPLSHGQIHTFITLPVSIDSDVFARLLEFTNLVQSFVPYGMLPSLDGPSLAPHEALAILMDEYLDSLISTETINVKQIGSVLKTQALTSAH